jgi:hypothetical protein
MLVLLLTGLLTLPVRQARADGGKFHRAEVARIQRHLRHVEVTLRQRDTHGLTPAQRAARTRALNHLRDYYRAGVFPKNEHFPGRRLPYFRDDHGTLCAMAYLIEKSGRKALVDRVARTNNNAYVRELAADPELQRWLKANGMTAAEAAWVQPAYNFPGENIPDPELQVKRDSDTGLWVKTIATTTLSGLSIYANTSTPRDRRDAQIRGWLGMAIGLATMGIGISNIEDGGKDRQFGWYNAGLGLVTTAFSLKTLILADKVDPKRAALGLPPQRRWEVSTVTAPTMTGLQAAYHF